MVANILQMFSLDDNLILGHDLFLGLSTLEVGTQCQ